MNFSLSDNNHNLFSVINNSNLIMKTQTHLPYAIPVQNQSQISQTEEFPQASIQHPSSSTQTSSFDLSKYFTKPIRNPIAYTKYREPQSLLELNKFVKTTFFPDYYHIPDSPLKTRQFYELILVDSKYVEFTIFQTNIIPVSYTHLTLPTKRIV